MNRYMLEAPLMTVENYMAATFPEPVKFQTF